jgi:AcrR family transcriptional regulator
VPCPGSTPSTAPVASTEGRTTRRRGATLIQAIFLATLEELAGTSFEELTFEKIAARAGTGKAALYRRWSTTAELVLAALSDPPAGFPKPAAPQTGSLRGDLLTILGAFAAALREPRGRALRPLLAQRPRHPELFEELTHAIVVPHQDVLLGILRSAVDRGEADPAGVNTRVASVGPRLLIMEAMHSNEVPAHEVEAIVDYVLLPLLAPRAGSRTSPPK